MTTFADALYQYGGQPVGVFQPDGSGVTYFVDNNRGNDGNDGLSWVKAFKTLSRATVISDAQTSSGGVAARRNTIFLSADRLVENITTLPSKCDVIGVGSTDGFKGGTLEGDQIVTSGTGTRFYNMGFEPGTSVDIFVVSSGVSSLEFHNCEFRADRGGATAISAIDVTASIGFKLFGNLFRGAFSGDVIDIGAGAVNHMEIIGNKIVGGANDGIIVTGTTTITGGQIGIIKDNLIQVAGVTINDGADSTLIVAKNNLISAANDGASSYVITVGFAVDNSVTTANSKKRIPTYA